MPVCTLAIVFWYIVFYIITLRWFLTVFTTLTKVSYLCLPLIFSPSFCRLLRV
jgi:hypothetical protein